MGFNEPIAFISRLVILVIKGSEMKKVVSTPETGRLLDLVVKDLGLEMVRGKVGGINIAYLPRSLILLSAWSRQVCIQSQRLATILIASLLHLPCSVK